MIEDTKLTPKEQLLLFKILNDKYAVGPFSGMIFNAAAGNNINIKQLIKKALSVRITMQEMSIN